MQMSSGDRLGRTDKIWQGSNYCKQNPIIVLIFKGL